MAKSLLKFLLLAALSAGASSLPNLLGGLSGLPGGKLPGLPAASAGNESSAELGRELAGLQETIADLKGLGENAPRPVSGLSAEERGLMADAAPKLEFRSNALTRQAGLVGGKGALNSGVAGKIFKGLKSRPADRFQSFSGFRADLLGFYGDHQAAMAYALWLIPAAAVLLSFLLFLIKRYTLSMMLTGLLFAMTNFEIWTISAAVGLSTILTKQSLLPVLPRELLLSPVIFLVVSAGLLRLADENYPFWNRTIGTLFAPIAVSFISAGWLNGAGLLKGLLAAAGPRT